MSPANQTSEGNNLLVSLATTMVVGYVTMRFRTFRTLWRFMPLLVVITAWFINRQAEEEAVSAAEAEAEAIA